MDSSLLRAVLEQGAFQLFDEAASLRTNAHRKPAFTRAEGTTSKIEFWECDFHYTCAFDVMSLSPGSMWWCYHLRRWYHLWFRRYEEGRAVDLGRRTAMESWVSKRVLCDLVAQGIHYLLSHVAGPFHSGFICNWQGQLFWFLVSSSAASCVIHTHTHICIYIYIYTYIYIHIHIHTQTFTYVCVCVVIYHDVSWCIMILLIPPLSHGHQGPAPAAP